MEPKETLGYAAETLIRKTITAELNKYGTVEMTEFRCDGVLRITMTVDNVRALKTLAENLK